MKICHPIINKICCDFGLPLTWQAFVPEHTMAQNIQTPAKPLQQEWTIEELPDVSMEQKELEGIAAIMQRGGSETIALAMYMDSKILVDGMNGISKIERDDLRPILIRSSRNWYAILSKTRASKAGTLHVAYSGMSPLKWIPREYNQQADHLCHYTLKIKQDWHKELRPPYQISYKDGDSITGWSDGGFDKQAGGTAGCIISIRRDDAWQVLCIGGVFDSNTSNNDSLRMEAVGQEQLFSAMLKYVNVV